MSSSSLSLYDENTGTTTYALLRADGLKTVWAVTGRSLAKPRTLEVERKLAPSGSASNDHVIVRVKQTEQSTLSPYKLTTAVVTLDVSIPRDVTGFSGGTPDVMDLVGNIVSLLNNKAALNVANASNTGLVAFMSGGDF